MLSCVVYGCENNTLTSSNPNISYYYFPKQPELVERWIQATGWDKEHIDLENSRICFIHFDESSYTTEYKVMDFLSCYTKVLKYDAIPTLYLPTRTEIVIKHSSECDDVTQTNQLAAADTEIKQMIVFVNTDQPTYQISSNHEEKCMSSGQAHKLSNHNFILPKQSLCKDLPNPESERTPTADDQETNQKYRNTLSEEELIKLKSSNDQLRKNIEQVERAVKAKELAMLDKQKEWKEKLARYKKMRQRYLECRRKLLIMKHQKSVLPKVFSSSQIKILSGKKKIYWSNDDMAVGYTIRHLSNKRCYSYLTRNLKIPLPAMSSIKRWISVKSKSSPKPIKSECDNISQND